MVANLIGAVVGLFLLAGLWTPVAGGVVAVVELWIAVQRQADPWIHLMMLSLVLGLAMLGPGAWSTDAHLFGRQRFEMTSRVPDR
jgi:hypothetical protein